MSGDAFDNVAPMRRPISPRGFQILERIEHACDIKPVLDREYVVKGVIDRGTVSVVYGDANVGKSFWAIDMAHHVHEGRAWAGRRVRQGAVLYVAAEGGAMFDNRLAARQARFMVLRGALTLAGRNSDGPPLAEAVCNLASGAPGPFSMIVVDTLARVMGGADENAAADIAGLMRSVDHIRERTGAHLMMIHHSGKDAARGARGHSSLRAAVDTEIELSKTETDRRIARVTKQRDMAGGAEFGFRLGVVELGRDSDGDQVTSCKVEHEGGHA